MPRPLPYREVARRLRAAGFIEYRQRGSHVRFIKTTPTGRVSVTVPRHRECSAAQLVTSCAMRGYPLTSSRICNIAPIR